MKKHILVLFAFVALFGSINCALLEPALAYQEDKVASTETKTSDHCLFCCSTHHQFVPASSTELFVNHPQSSEFIPFRLAPHSDPAIGSIFRPPLAH
jgi:hypothetical protein